MDIGKLAVEVEANQSKHSTADDLYGPSRQGKPQHATFGCGLVDDQEIEWPSNYRDSTKVMGDLVQRVDKVLPVQSAYLTLMLTQSAAPVETCALFATLTQTECFPDDKSIPSSVKPPLSWRVCPTNSLST